MSKIIERCPKDLKKLVNPKTGRCVMENNPTIKELIKQGYTILVTPNPNQPEPPPSSPDVKIFRICPTDKNKLVNPLTGRCIMQKSPIVAKLLKEGWSIAFNKPGITPLVIKPKKKVNVKLLKKELDTNKDGILSINEFLDSREITSIEEYNSEGNFDYLRTNENIPKFLMAMHDKHPIFKKNLCLFRQGYSVLYNRHSASYPKYSVWYNASPKEYLLDQYRTRKYTTNAYLWSAPELTNLASQPVLTYHPEMIKNIRKCKERFFASALTLTKGAVDENLTNGHSNVLFFDTKNKTIDRYDPHGSFCGGKDEYYSCPSFNQIEIDNYLADKFAEILPEYRFIDFQTTCPYVGPQGKGESGNFNSRGGYCVTWSLMFTVLRILNPEKKVDELNYILYKGTPSQIRNKMLRFAKFYSDVLKKSPRGIV